MTSHWPEIPASPTGSRVISEHQIVSLHTFGGVQLDQFLGNELIECVWSREVSETSRCELTVPSTIDHNRLPNIQPWLHWVSVWDDSGQDLYWTGPIRRVEGDRESIRISARDVSSLFSRTRCPIQKRWENGDPADIANEMWQSMGDWHGLNLRPVVRQDPFGDRFDYTAVGEEAMLDVVMDELVHLGLRWSVVSGVPLLGPLPHTPVAALTEDDFVNGGLTLVRDGSSTFNDVLLRGGADLARARVPMAGLNLQTVVDIDSMFGVGNADRAVRQYARYVSKIHDSVTLPETASLHPDAPVSIGQLIPTARLVIDAYGLLLPVELTGVDVSLSTDSSDVSIRVTGVDDDLPELIEVQRQADISGGTPL